MPGTDAVVVGGGVIGCAVARELRARDLSVVVLERDRPGVHASWAAAGMLSPLAEADGPGPFLRLLIAARERYPALARSLLAQTSIDIGYREDGTLLLALTDEDEALLEARWRWESEAGLPVERLDAAGARELEPTLSAEVRWALRFPDDHQVDNRKLAAALQQAAAGAGAELRRDARVKRIVVERGRAVGAELEDGEVVRGEAVVLAAGSWTGKIEGLPRPVPVGPVHGQLLALDTHGHGPRHVIDTPRVYLVPRADGRLIVGATVEDRGFSTLVTGGATRALRKAAAEAIPELADADVLEVWSGLRPGTPDGRPIVGADPDVTNLFYATGHYRNGILLAPITGEAIAASIAGDPAPAELEEFGIERFADQSPR